MMGDHDQHKTKDQEEVHTLIVGFGFSVITLLRELERSGHPYTLVSQGKTIWEHLHDKDKLQFDLVSSYHTSVFTEDQVKDPCMEDFFPTATENYEYHKNIMAPFRDKVVEDWVVSVDNHSNHSMVYCQSGKLYKAANVVFATGLSRPQNDLIKNLDLSRTQGKTVVFDIIGDTTNMMCSWLVPQGNKLILLNNGFVALDKFISLETPGPKDWYVPIAGARLGKRYQIDLSQMESHMVGKFFPHFYSASIGFPWTQHNWISNLFMGDMFHFKFPQTYRKQDIELNAQAKAGVGNGMIGIKYYPVDMYQSRYGRTQEELEESIAAGRLLNDIVFWHTQGFVESWSKDQTTIDRKNKTIMGPSGEIVAYDILIDGSAREQPNLPPITVHEEFGDNKHEYSYKYRESYLGVVPKRLKNIFFIGYTRPTTGGAATIVEMQGLFVHKLLTQPDFKHNLYSSLEDRINKYNNFYYPSQSKTTSTDHLVFYGLLTQEIAECMGIDRPVWPRVSSWGDLRQVLTNVQFEMLTPNNAYKYRMTGEYKIQGASHMARSIFEYLENFSLVKFSALCLASDMVLGWQCCLMLFLRYAKLKLMECLVYGGEVTDDVVSALGITVLLLLGAKTWYDNLATVFLQALSMPVLLVGLRAHFQPLFMMYILWEGEWYWCPGLFCSQIVINFLSRQFFAFPYNGRYVFGDCKYKHKYQSFYEEYRRLYLKVKKM